MTPAEIIAATTALMELLTQATNLVHSIQAAHAGAAPGTSTQQVADAAGMAVKALAKLQVDLKGA